MGFLGYVILWAILSAGMGYEYYALYHEGVPSLLRWAATQYDLAAYLETTAGKPLSLFVGWTGFCLIAMTNIYILRKRIRFMQNWGNIHNWLNFHIFLGMVGPTMIVFHTNFKIGGLVAISFWSMVIVALSGIVGRYLFMQVLQVRGDLASVVKDREDALQKVWRSLAVDPAQLEWAKQQALRLAGLPAASVEVGGGLRQLAFSAAGDVRLQFGGLTKLGPAPVRSLLKDYTVARRQLVYYETFKKYLGYWHSFHLPFAYFMYVVAVIHIVSALIFKV